MSQPVIPPEFVESVILIEGIDAQGQEIYAYVKITADNIPAFQLARTQAGFDPTEFGEVLAYGFGTPDAETQQRMHKEFGFTHEGMLAIPEPSDG